MSVEPLPQAIGLVRELKAHGASPQTIDDALKKTPIPETLQNTVEILFGVKPEKNSNKPVPYCRSLIVYQPQPSYP